MGTKLTGALIALLFTSTAMAKATDASDVGARMAQKLPPPKTVNECMSQWRTRIPDPRPKGKNQGLKPSDMCMNSIHLPADQGRCVEIYNAVIEAYQNAEDSVKEVCKLVPEAAAASCDGQGNCVGGSAEFRKKYADNLEIHYGYVNTLIEKMDAMGKMGLDVSEQYAADLKEFKSAEDPNQASVKARSHGGSSIKEALLKHGDQDVDSVLRIIQAARQSSTISQREIEPLNSPYVFEQLQASATAFDQKRDLQEYATSLRSQQREAAAQATKLEQQSSNMASLSQSSMLPSMTGIGALPAAGAVTGSTDTTGYPIAQLSGSTPSPATEVDTTRQLAAPRARSIRAPSGAAGEKNQLALAAGGAVVADASLANGPGSTAGTTTMGASAPAGSLRDELRAKLARNSRTSKGVGGGDGASLSATKESIAASKKAEATSEVLAETGSQFSSAPIEPMMMKNSETEGAVKDIVNNFERSLDNRSPASLDTESGSEILTSESPSLFLRLKEVHVRCIKRGCVGRVTKGAI